MMSYAQAMVEQAESLHDESGRRIVSYDGSRGVWVAPGGATTRSERTARGWYTRLLALRDTPEAEDERMQDGHQL